MTEKEVIERLNDLIDTCNKGIEKHPYYKELFETDKEALQTALQLLEQKYNKINKVIDKLKEEIIEERNFMKDLEHKSMAFHYANGRETLAKDLLKILEE